jgi:hypothetical protein
MTVQNINQATVGHMPLASAGAVLDRPAAVTNVSSAVVDLQAQAALSPVESNNSAWRDPHNEI